MRFKEGQDEAEELPQTEEFSVKAIKKVAKDEKENHPTKLAVSEFKTQSKALTRFDVE